MNSPTKVPPTQLLYVADPMCSWCWGFTEVLNTLESELRDDVRLTYVMGGLAPDSDAPMDAATKSYVQDAWRAVAARTGATFQHDFWERCSPRRSTWPACRLVLAASDRGREVFHAIQRAYYLEARDPSDPTTLAQIAAEFDVDPDQIDDPATHALLEADFALRESLGIRGYPTLATFDGTHGRVLTRGWVDLDTARAALRRAGLLNDA
tara:strand:+ start:2449 stop:3075 length:627 start_codon:yes stop_codon:yes gene_type:complete